MDTTESVLSVRDILRVLFKRKWIVVTVTLAALATSAIIVFLMPPTYESTAQILVKRALPETEEPSLSQEPRNAPTSYRQVNQADEMNTAISIIKSRDLVVSVMDATGLTREQFDKVPDFRRYVRALYTWLRETVSEIWSELKYLLHLSKRPTPEERSMLLRERFVNDVADALVVEQVTDSDVLRVGIRCSDPMLARSFSNRLSNMAISWHFEKFRQSGNLAFFKDQGEKASNKLVQIEKTLVATRNDLNLIGIEERKKLIIENRYQSQARLNDVGARIAADDAGIREVERMLAAEPPMVTLSKETGANPLRQQISEKLADLELKRVETLERNSREGRIVKDMDTTLQGWRSQMEKVDPKRENLVVEGVNSVHQALRQKLISLNADKAALTAESRMVRKHIEEYDAELKTINDRAYKVQDLERQLRTQGGVYEQYLKNTELARVEEAKQTARMANLNLVQSSPLPVSPVKPKKWTYILLSGLGGFLLSVAWAFAAELNDNSLNSEADLKNELGVQALGTLRECKEKELAVFPPTIPEILLEDVHLICRRLLQHGESGGSIVAGFVSSGRGEGTTTVLLQTAIAAAGNAKNVILVDADPRGSLTKLFDMEERTGLSDLAAGCPVGSIIHKTVIPNLSLVPAGKDGRRGGMGTDWSALTMELRKHAGIVFFDVPPILTQAWETPVFPSCDGIVFVVAAHQTRRELLQRAIAEMERHEKMRLFGGVLNKRKFFIPGILYHHV